MMNLWDLYILGVVVLLGMGIYCLVSQRNLIQLIIGIEIIAKAATLSFILAGYVQENEQIAQSIAITIVLIEAISTAVVLSLIVTCHRHTGTLDVNVLKRLRG